MRQLDGITRLMEHGDKTPGVGDRQETCMPANPISHKVELTTDVELNSVYKLNKQYVCESSPYSFSVNDHYYTHF